MLSAVWQCSSWRMNICWRATSVQSADSNARQCVCSVSSTSLTARLSTVGDRPLPVIPSCWSACHFCYLTSCFPQVPEDISLILLLHPTFFSHTHLVAASTDASLWQANSHMHVCRRLSAPSLLVFRQKLKTHLFRQSYIILHYIVVCVACCAW